MCLVFDETIARKVLVKQEEKNKPLTVQSSKYVWGDKNICRLTTAIKIVTIVFSHTQFNLEFNCLRISFSVKEGNIDFLHN